MKIKDLPKNTLLGNINFISPEGWIGTWISSWEKGVWARKRNNSNPDEIFPIFVNDLKECYEWPVVRIKSKTDPIERGDIIFNRNTLMFHEVLNVEFDPIHDRVNVTLFNSHTTSIITHKDNCRFATEEELINYYKNN
jgi:hypothetical protein